MSRHMLISMLYWHSMDREQLLLHAEYRWHHLFLWLRYKQLRATNQFYIARRSRLRIAKDAQVSIGKGTHFMRNFTADIYGELFLGENVYFQHDCCLCCHSSVTIGDNCLFGERVSIHDENHLPGRGDDPIGSRGFDVKAIVIGKNVWVGANAVILPGVTIGNNAVIGANAVVSRDVPAYTIVGGVPARVLKEVKEVSAT